MLGREVNTAERENDDSLKNLTAKNIFGPHQVPIFDHAFEILLLQFLGK